MADNVYLNNRLKYHTASRVAISTAQSMMQATNADGHTVTSAQVWASDNKDFPKNTSAFAESSNVVGATNDLVSVFKNGNEYAVVQGISDNLAGKVFRNDDFPAVELYQNVEMTAVDYSDNQAWQIKNGNNRVMDWCSPTAVKNGVLPVPGYTGIAQATTTNGTTWTILQDSSNLSYGWSLASGNWEFVYMSGMLTFHPDYIPSKMSFQRIRFTGFRYIGEYLSDSITGIQSKIENTVSVGLNKTLAIKPYSFTLDKMVKNENFYSIVVPGFVIKAEDSKGITIGDFDRIDNGQNAGDTKITFELEAQQQEVLQSQVFVAYSFVNKDGTKISMLETTML